MSEQILLAEDENILRDANRRLLECDGYKVVAVASGEEALTLLAEGEKFDLIISDYEMRGGMDGVWLLRQIREIRRYKHCADTPFILMSGRLDVSDDDQSSLADVAAKYGGVFFHKSKSIREAVREFLSANRQSDE